MKQNVDLLQAGMNRKNALNYFSDSLWLMHLKLVARCDDEVDTMKCFRNQSISDNRDLISVFFYSNNSYYLSKYRIMPMHISQIDQKM